MENFTPLASLIGGVLIGLSASAMLFFNGKVAGVSGIVGGILKPVKEDVGWRLAFVAGLLVGGSLLDRLAPVLFNISIVRSFGVFLIAGALVGFGARMGNGCTSGHGVCGMSRFSVRSMIATLLFIVSGAATVYVVNEILGASI